VELTPIVPGSVHLQVDGRTALFGSPPEIVKFIARAGLEIPPVGVLPDVSYVDGVSQMALEFPAYWFIFKKGRAPHERFRVIGRREMCERLRSILSITLFGPDRSQLKRWKLSKSRIDTLVRLMDHMAIKHEGRKLTLDDLFEFVHFPEGDDKTGVPLFANGNVMVRRLGENRFRVTRGRRQRTIDLGFEGEQLPLLADPAEGVELPQVLGVKLLGTCSGFDHAGPTTGMVLWLNCNGFLVDGPVGTSMYLRRLGIPKSDLRGIVLSHVHDDHCTLMDMILSEQTTNIITTREIYESMLIKVAGVLGERIDEIRNYLTFTEVIPGKTLNMYGARWEFFYSVHSIPTVGFRVSVRDAGGRDHTLVHSSDTIHFAGLDEMRRAGAISAAHERRMKELVRGGERLVMIDGGGPPIHGVPSDFEPAMARHPDTDFLFYHTNPERVTCRTCEVAQAGWSKTYLSGKTLSQALLLKLLKTMKLLEVSDITWINILISQGNVIEVPPDRDVVSQGQNGDAFYFVLAGSQQVLDTSGKESTLLAVLEGGDFFGEMSIIRDAKRNATVRTLSASVLFKLPGDVFLDFVEANGLKERFERIWLSRSIISGVKIFRNLHPHAKHELSLLADTVSFGKGDMVIRQGGKTDDFYIITQGFADVVRRNGKGGKRPIGRLRKGDFFGENVAMGYKDRRNASVVVTSKKFETLRISGRDLRRLAESAPVLRHELHLVMKERGMTEIPVSPRESVEPRMPPDGGVIL
jgi:CRP-like cAMP-binding protein/glyoxylase-like metal-dependent hydrolase (beta-lactamase superfamily II)